VTSSSSTLAARERVARDRAARDRAAYEGATEVVLAIDRIACDGYGSCAELVPELIALDEWGYPIIRPGPVPSALLEHARMAVDTCPVLALRLATPGRATITSGRETRGKGG
jgi:ferredoxin